MRTTATATAIAVALGAALIGAGGASAASRDWHACSKAATKAAAQQAGLPARMDADERLRTVFGGGAPSSVLTTIARSLCADFDGDGDVDRLAMYACCTVSSPSPFAILRNNRPGAGYAVAYSRLDDAVFSIRTAGRDLLERDPRYAAGDANCCPSRIRERRIHWSQTRFRTTVRIRLP
ncbi:MAG: hypothetical protein QOJ89_1523 [bacterium]|jgi:hypothetical protein